MGARTGLSLLFAALLVTGTAAASDVLTLTGKTHDDAIAKNDFVVVEYYAPWCGHCKSLTPHWEAAATTLKKEGSEIKLAKVDATEDQNKALAERIGVKGFPTIKIFRKGAEPADYNGPREAEGIVSFLKKQAGPASAEISKAADLEAKLAEEDVLIVGYFPKGFSGPEYDAYTAAAQALREDFSLAHTSDAAAIPGDCPSEPAVIVFKKFDDLRAQTTDLSSADAVKAFVEAKSTPWVVELNQDPKNRPHLKRLFEKPSAKLLGFHTAGEGENMREGLVAAAKKFDSLKFVIVEAGSNEQALKYFGLETKDCPAYVIHDAEADKKYVKESAEPSEIDGMVTAYMAGELKQRIKSEAEPEDNSGPVLVLTANNWEKNVVKGKTYMLEFYAPWCGHCKTLAPIYEKVGAHFKGKDNVVIAKMDATANDVTDSRFSVKGFPTLYLLTASGEVMPYQGDRSEKEIIRFVEEFAADGTAADETDEAFAAEHDEL